MAIIGFETDQVIRTASGDVSVPINVAYNHHFECTISGSGSRFEKVAVPPGHTPQMHGGHGAPNLNEAWVLLPREGDAEYVALKSKAGVSRVAIGGVRRLSRTFPFRLSVYAP